MVDDRAEFNVTGHQSLNIKVSTFSDLKVIESASFTTYISGELPSFPEHLSNFSNSSVNQRRLGVGGWGLGIRGWELVSLLEQGLEL
jgi:hypothetical protein